MASPDISLNVRMHSRVPRSVKLPPGLIVKAMLNMILGIPIFSSTRSMMSSVTARLRSTVLSAASSAAARVASRMRSASVTRMALSELNSARAAWMSEVKSWQRNQ